MKMPKRLAAFALVCVLSASLFGCSGNKAADNATDQKDNNVAVNTTEGDGPLVKYQKPVELTIMHQLYGDERYLPGEDINNNVWTRAYEKELGIKLNYVWAAAGDDFKQKLTMSIASNDLPDLIELPAKEFNQLAVADKLADLTSAYDTYASDLLKTTITADGGIQLKSGYKGGQLFGIPQPSAADSSADLIWVRSDWMKNLGLSQPKTIDDVINMAKAFKNNDPDKNGKNDTYGIGFQKVISEEGGSVCGSFEGFFAGYGAYSRAWELDKNGTAAYSGIKPGMKDALAKLNTMFKDGLIDQEFGVKDWKKLGEDIASGKVGLFYGREAMPWLSCKDSIVNNPKADWVSYPIVSATSEPAHPMTYVTLTRYFAVNKSCKNPEALFKLANLFQEKINSIHSSLETLNQYGVDPKTGINFAAYPAFGMDPSVQKCNTYYKEIKDVFDGKANVKDIHPEAMRYYNTMKEYVDSGFDKAKYPVGWNYYKFIGPEGAWNTITGYYKENKLLKQSVWFGAPTMSMRTKGATLDKLQAESYVKIITGNSPIDSFDTFVSNWKKLGGDDITKEVNDWYKTTFAK